MQLMCWNRVEDYDVWKKVFDSHADDHRAECLQLLRLWRSVDDPNHIFFLFEVRSREEAQAFLDDPVSAEAGEAAGVVDGGYYFVEELGGYEV